MNRSQTVATALGLLRVGFGGTLLGAPRFAMKVWAGPDAAAAGGTVFARVVGGRDLALGASTLAALGSPADTVTLLRLGAMSDLADTAATVMAWREFDTKRRWSIPLVSFAAGVVGLAAARSAAAANSSEVPTLSDGIKSVVGERDDVDLRRVNQARV